MCKYCKTKIIKTTTTEEAIGYLWEPKLYPEYEKIVEIFTKVFDRHLEYILKDVEGMIFLNKTTDIEAYEDLVDELNGPLAQIYLYGQISTNSKTLAELALLNIVPVTEISIVDERSRDYAKNHAGELIRWVNETTEKQVNALITKSIEEGRSQKELTKQLYEKFSQFNQARAKLIAHQETALAYGGGSYNQFINDATTFGQTGRKHNNDQNDAKVRPEHVANTLEGRIPASQPFKATDTLYEPHGYNCRCVVTYRMFKPTDDTL